MKPGYFHANALAARERRRDEQTEFGREDVAPLRILEWTAATLAKRSIAETRSALEDGDKGVIFLVDRHQQPYGMVVGTSFSLLLELRDALQDPRRFRLTTPGEQAEFDRIVEALEDCEGVLGAASSRRDVVAEDVKAAAFRALGRVQRCLAQIRKRAEEATS